MLLKARSALAELGTGCANAQCVRAEQGLLRYIKSLIARKTYP
jgi:hypothetical protein